MTTIVYRDGIMAADSCVSYNDAKTAAVTKIWEVEGTLIGVSGSLSALAMVRSVVTDAGSIWPAMARDEHCSGIMVAPSGVIHFVGSNGIPIEVDAEFHAIGSGAELAIGAMAAGASAAEAVKIAIQYDCFSAGPIDILSLQEEVS